MSRASTPTSSHQESAPETSTVPNATAMKSLSATGSMKGPKRELPNRRASKPSSRSEPAASASTTSRQVSLDQRKGDGQRQADHGEEVGDA